MVFNSYQFVLFFPIVVFLYYFIPSKYRWISLLASSYYFYMCWNLKYVILLLFVTIITFIGAICLSTKSILENPRLQKFTLSIFIILTFLPLIVFKYWDFFVNNLNASFTFLFPESTFQTTTLDLLLPMGISFYSFQAISYMMDVYSGSIQPERNLFRYALFIAFFPQLVAGPIERSKNLLPQLHAEHTLSYDNIIIGFWLMLWGYFQKLIIANRLATVVDSVYENIELYFGTFYLFASILFAIQIYCDFQAYSLIAKGAAKILGFDLMNNFDSPYLASTVSDFWRRWHISLTSWFKDYLYIPLGGNKKGKFRKYINQFLVFTLSGLWHGANWTFVIWGALNGTYQIIEDILPFYKKIPVFIRRISVFILIDFSWIFFRSSNIHQALHIIRSILTSTKLEDLFNGSLLTLGVNKANMILLFISLAILLLIDILHHSNITVLDYILRQKFIIRFATFIFVFFVILIFGQYGTGIESTFIYFQF